MSARVTRPDDAYEVSLDNGVWMVNGQVGDSLQVTNWIRRFSPLSADGFFDDIPVQILTDPVIVLIFQPALTRPRLSRQCPPSLRLLSHPVAVNLHTEFTRVDWTNFFLTRRH